MKTKHRKATSANGNLDSYAIAAEQLASYLTRRGKPPQVTLERIANLAEKAMNYVHTLSEFENKITKDEKRKLERIYYWKEKEGIDISFVIKGNKKAHKVKDNRAPRKEGRESQRNKVLDRIWAAYQMVQEEEIMHPYAQGKDETWNGAKQIKETWKSEPMYYYGDHFDYVIGDELYGNKAQGRTPIRDSNYNGDEGDDK